MQLFDETESKYYELVLYLLKTDPFLSKDRLRKVIDEYLPGEQDFEVIEALFDAQSGEELIFRATEDGGIKPVAEGDYPIRFNLLEKQAAKSLLCDSYIHSFLSADTIEKLDKATADIAREWDPADLVIKNASACPWPVPRGSLGMVAKAIRNGLAIKYANIRPGYIELRDCVSYPVRIEFSVVNRRFRVCAYEPGQDRFIKMNLDTLQDITLLEEPFQRDLQKEYKDYIRMNMRSVTLEVEPVGHAVERCFRVFSYFDRRATYDPIEKKYNLEVFYLRADESEIIKNILSMGSYVVVREPENIRKRVLGRIRKARELYGGQGDA